MTQQRNSEMQRENVGASIIPDPSRPFRGQAAFLTLTPSPHTQPYDTFLPFAFVISRLPAWSSGHGRSQEHGGHSFPPPVISVPLNLSPRGSPGLSISDFWGFTEKMTITVFVKFVHHFFLVLSLTRVKDFP